MEPNSPQSRPIPPDPAAQDPATAGAAPGAPGPAANSPAAESMAADAQAGFAQATLAELRRVVWPSRQQLFSESVAVILMVSLSAAAIAAIDRFYGWAATQVFR